MDSSRRAQVLWLMADVAAAFRHLPAIGEECVAYGIGDAASVERIVRIFQRRHWTDVSAEEVRRCGADELRNHLTASGLKHFLPAILNASLHFLSTEGESRLTEAACLMLLPAGSGYEEVWLEFSDGLYSRGIDDPHWRALLEKIAFVRSEYDAVQRRTIARFIGLMENVDDLPLSSQGLVVRWMGYWEAKDGHEQRRTQA